jgi:polyhydroxyalkanoate synthesis regulator phasin
MPIAEGIAAAKAAIEVSKIISDLVNRPNINAEEVRSRVHQMLIHVVNAQTALAEANVEISELRHRLDDREALRTLNADLEVVSDGDYYIRKSERDIGKPVPYWPACWGATGKLLPLVSLPTRGVLHCPIHKVLHYTKTYHDGLDDDRRTALSSSRMPPGPDDWMR